MEHPIIYPLHVRNQPEQIGNKARNLRALMGIRKIKTPESWVIPWDVFQRYQAGDNLVFDELEAAFQNHLDLSKTYAVRSSSNIEDDRFVSFAGLFKTVLHVKGSENVCKAVVEVWESTQTEIVDLYVDKINGSPDAIQMAVIIQEMVPPVFSGVLFSCNPMTGLSEVVIEGVPGDGTALVQDGVTPERWVS